jgi:hypothetical protein
VSTALFESVTRIARHEVGRRAVAGVGEVMDVYPAAKGATPPDHAVSVKMRDSGLILPRVPVAVGVMGFAAIPAPGDLVLIVFLEGDINAPVMVGRIYQPDLDPPEHETGQVVLKLPAGKSEPKLDLVVQGDEPSIKLLLPDKVTIEIVKDKVLIEVGDMSLSVDGAGGGRAEVAAGGSKITLKKDGDISVSSAGNLTLEGKEVKISGTAKVSVKGAQVEIN